jgi:hypothetical protein
VSRGGPSVAEERALELRARKLPAPGVPWRTNTVFWSLLLFTLTVLTVAAAFWLLDEFGLPKGWLIGAVALAVAELLIRRYRFFGTGVESALWIGGLFAVIFGLHGSGKPEALLLFVAASAIAGFRMRNAVFGATAAVVMVAYFAARDVRAVAAAFGLALSMAALLAITRELRRPSTEWLLCALLIIPPIAGAVVSARQLSAVWATAYLAAACACAVVGIRTRAHALLIAAAVHTSLAIGTLAVHHLLPWQPEWQMITGGAILLALSAALSRALRSRTAGMVITPERLTPFDDTLQVGGALALQAGMSPGAPPREIGGGGRFGGGGASGDF